MGYEPELIAAVGTNGEEGYVYASDEELPPRVPQRPLPCKEQGKSEGRYVPLYASDGKTVVDRLFLAPESRYGK